MADRLGWREGTTLTLLIGSAESAGKIALKPKAKGPISVTMMKVPRTKAVSYGRVYVGHFEGLDPAAQKSTEPVHEQKNDQLIRTLP